MKTLLHLYGHALRWYVPGKNRGEERLELGRLRRIFGTWRRADKRYRGSSDEKERILRIPSLR